ncbi:MAG: sigma-70 family RNA polymerase sigma factor [Candidatus Eisenbacteria bacterium]|nr:sigma-70 family RNA polymerase sigma factor [Candidatus Eisenbacteria bacterium]
MESKPDDKSLVARARAGDEECFRILIRRYQRDVFRLCYRILRNNEDAEDASQDVFIRLHRSLGQYDPSHLFRSWLLRITHNLCIDHLRRRRMTTVSLDEPIRRGDGEIEWDLPDPDAMDPLDATALGQEREMLEEAIARLGPTLRSAITLRHVHGLRYEEIAETLDVPLGTVKVRIFRARAALAEMLGERLGRERK